MIDKITGDNLYRSVSQVFEEAAFCLLQTGDDDDFPYIPGNITSSMDFKGPLSGTVYIITSSEQAAQLAGNLLGIDEDDDEAQLKTKNALMELLNMVVGIFINKVYGESKSYFFGIPNATSLNNSEFTNLIETAKLKVNFIDDMDNLFYSVVKLK